jgi:molybdopterin biosynthesis enzyme
VARADGFIRFAEGNHDYESGDVVEFFPMFHGPL